MEIKEAFDLFDAEERGYIEPKELKDAMASLGLDERSKIIYEMISNIDDETDRLDFREFLDLMTARMSEKDSKEDIKKVFRLFDEDSKGYINITNLKRVAKDLGENMDDIELQEMVERADADGDGIADFRRRVFPALSLLVYPLWSAQDQRTRSAKLQKPISQTPAMQRTRSWPARSTPSIACTPRILPTSDRSPNSS